MNPSESSPWSIERARKWQENQPWFFGANFTPSTAINQLEMWQADTFDPITIERELGYAHDIGMNIMRVYLHDLLWEHDRDDFIERIETYLEIADSKQIKTMFTIFDDCWHGPPKLGRQPDPVPYKHNSGWLQSPGHAIVEDPNQWDRLERYVTELIGHFKDDTRIAVWDLYNEPCNGEDGDDGRSDREGKSLPLVEAVFRWARSVDGVSQPFTVAFWSPEEALTELALKLSDIITFHSYDAPEKGFLKKLERATSEGRPAICTEYMSRSTGCTFKACLPIMKERKVGAINWGLVSGKTQTIYPWGWSADKGEPPVYFHDIFNPDGSFLYANEGEDIRGALGDPE